MVRTAGNRSTKGASVPTEIQGVTECLDAAALAVEKSPC